jgi:hypothetical protein
VPHWEQEHHGHHGVHLPTPAEVLEGLDLAEGQWEVLIAEEHEREQTERAGPGHRFDNVVKARRRTGAA